MRIFCMGVVLAAWVGMGTLGAGDYNKGTTAVPNAVVWDNTGAVNVKADNVITDNNADIIVNVSGIAPAAVETEAIVDAINITAGIENAVGGTNSATLNFINAAAGQLPLIVNNNITLAGDTGDPAGSSHATLNIGAGYTIDVARSTILGENSTLAISGDGGAKGVLQTASLGINAANAALVVNTDGELHVANNASIGNAGTSGTSDLTVNTGGSVTVGGSLQAGGGARITIKNGGVIDIASLKASGNAAVAIDGTVTAGNSIDAGGNATVQFLAGATVSSLSQLGVRDNAVVDINAAVTAGTLEFAGGTINLNAALDAGALSAAASGRLNFNRNNATATFTAGDVAFSGGGIYVGSGVTGAAMTVTGGGLTIGGGAVLDTGPGAFSATIAGDFTLNGTLNVGYANEVLMADVATTGGGALTVGNTARVTMTSDLQRQVAAAIGSGGELRVFKTDAATVNGSGTLRWDAGSVIYQYTVRAETGSGDGGGGIWVTGTQTISRDQLHAAIMSRWGELPIIGEDAGTVLPGDFVDAIIDANRLVTGVDPGYDSLSVSGKFNADALSAMANPNLPPGAGYDALMLYNGSGLAMANQAMLSSNAAVLRYISRRAEDIRREIRGNDVVDPDSYAPLPLPPSRVWAEAMYHTEKTMDGDGFAGYDASGAGVIVGYEHLFGDLAVGASASYLAGSFENRAALEHGSRIDTYGLDAYATLTAPSGWFGAVILGYGYTDNRLRDYRSLAGVPGWNSGDYGSHTLKISASFGRDYWIGDYLTVSPSVGFEYIGSRSAEHRQFFVGDGRSGGAETLAAGVVKSHSSRVPIGVSASYNVMGDDDSLLTLTGNVGYAYELNDDGPSGVVEYTGLGGIAGPVGIVRRDRGRHAFTAGLRGKYYFRRYEFGFGYEYTGKRMDHQHSLWVNGGMNF